MSDRMIIVSRFISFLLSLLLLSGCSSLHLYHVEIDQGRVINSMQLKQLHKGMSKEEVARLLGVPMQEDYPPHPNRWEYVHFHQDTRGVKTTKKLTVYFRSNKVSRFISTY